MLRIHASLNISGNESGSIGKLSDLRKVGNKYQILSTSQNKNIKDTYTFKFWISSDAGNSEQGKSYTFAFKVDATIE